MDCAAFEAGLAEFVDGTADERTASQMATHLAGCRACARLHAAHQVVGRSLSGAAFVPAPAGFEMRLYAAVVCEEALGLLADLRRQGAAVVAGALAGLLPLYVGLVSLWLGSGAPPPNRALARLLAANGQPLAAVSGLWDRIGGAGLTAALKAAVFRLVEPVALPGSAFVLHPLCLAAAAVALGAWVWYGSAPSYTPRSRA